MQTELITPSTYPSSYQYASATTNSSLTEGTNIETQKKVYMTGTVSYTIAVLDSYSYVVEDK